MADKDNAPSLVFKGTAGDYFKIWLINTVLTILSGGLYSAWAKVRTKRYLYQHTQLNGQAFEYHGQAWRILGVRLAVVAFCGLSCWFWLQNEATILVSGGLATLLLPILIWDWRRSELRAIHHGGIQFSFHGRLWQTYTMFFIRIIIANVVAYYILTHAPEFIHHISQGQYPKYYILSGSISVFMLLFMFLAWFDSGFKHYLINHVQYGKLKFYSSLNVVEMFHIYLKPVLLILGIVVVFGSTYLMYHIFHRDQPTGLGTIFLTVVFHVMMDIALLYACAYLLTKRAEYIAFNQFSDSMLVTFKSSVTTPVLFKLMLTNGLMLVGSFGLAWPIVKIRTLHYLIEHYQVIGDIDQVIACDARPDMDSSSQTHIVELESA